MWTPLGTKWSGADVCPASIGGQQPPRAHMGVCGSGPVGLHEMFENAYCKVLSNTGCRQSKHVPTRDMQVIESYLVNADAVARGMISSQEISGIKRDPWPPDRGADASV